MSTKLPAQKSLLHMCRTRSNPEIRQVILEALQSSLIPRKEEDEQQKQGAMAAPLMNLLSGTLSTLLEEEQDQDETPLTLAFVYAWVDALWLFSLSSSSASNEKDGSSFTPLVELVRCLSESAAGSIARPYMLQTLEAGLLEQAGVLKHTTTPNLSKQADWLKKLRLYSTQTYYKQQKFNLLAEESQGYAKLLTVLTTAVVSVPSAATNTSILVEQVRTLTTTFHLDPNRCSDLILHILARDFSRLQKNATITQHHPLVAVLCEASPVDKLPALLHFQLQGLGVGDDAVNYNSSSPRQALLQCMAWLSTCPRRTGSQPVVGAADQGSSSVLLPIAPMWSYLWGDQEAQLLDDLYQQHCKRDLYQVTEMVRVRLSSTPTAASGNKEDAMPPPPDLTPLSHSLAIQWLRFLLRQEQTRQVLLSSSDGDEDSAILTDMQWSQLFVLFPDTLGVAICQALQSQVSGWLQNFPDSLPPWKRTNEKDEKLLLPPMPTLQQVLAAIVKPLSLLRESACIVRLPILYSQICQLIALCLQQKLTEKNSSNLAAVKGLLRNFLLPSLSLFPANAAVSHQVWSVAQYLPYGQRYSLYASWRGNCLEKAALKQFTSSSTTSKKSLWLIKGELQAGKDARYALKRLSKDTIRDLSRAVAKVSHSHPLVIFTTILDQIEAYDNMVQVMVDVLRFVTPFSLDVLGFCILSRLSGDSAGVGSVNRSRLKEDGVNVSQWLQSLESFTGAFYKRFPMIEFQGILCYLMNRLKDGHVMELGVLRTLLKTSGGWAFADYAPAASLSGAQLEGRTGSTLLKRETMSFGVVDKDTSLRAANEIRHVLQEQDMGASLLILLSQACHQIVFGSTAGRPKPVKLIGNLVDTCQVTIAILLDFLTNPSDCRTEAIHKYAKSLPSIVDLCQVYKMDVASVWMLCRPLVRAADSLDDEMEDLDARALEAFKSTDEARKSYEALLPKSTWAHITTDLFEVFYVNTVYDLSCPEEVYAAEISRLDKETERLSKSKTTPQPSSLQPGVAAPVNEAEELDRVKRVAAELSLNFSAQKKHIESIHESIRERSVNFFNTDQISKRSVTTFFSRCIYPRCMQGPDDAMYCARFVFHLHSIETPGFSTMRFLDCMIVALSRSLFGLTEGEAANVAILLFETWKVLSRWRYAKDCFATEVAGKPGALMSKFSDSTGEAEVQPVSEEDFQELYNKWHAAIGASCLGCLQSSEYMHQRSCLIVLTRMVDAYPTRPKLANKLLKALAPLQEESNSLADIRASAQAYSTQLLKARDEGVWKEEDAATVQARLQKEQEAAVARQEKAVKQMKEMERESQKISEEIGDRDVRWGERRRDGQVDARRPLGRVEEIRRGHEDRRDDRRRTSQPPPPPPPRAEDRWVRDRASNTTGPSPGSYNSIPVPPPPPRGHDSAGVSGRRGDEGQDHRGLEGRWQRASDGPGQRTGGVGVKRSRPSSPVDQDDRGERASKRPRSGGGLEPGEEAPPPRGEDSSRRGDDGGGRRRAQRYRR